MRAVHIFILCVAVFVLVFTSCQDSDVKISASGVFEATEILISSEATGKILHFDITEGQKLEVGQELGLIDSVQLELKKEQLLANIKSLKSRFPDITIQLAPIHQQITTARTEKKRFENLIEAGASNQKQLDDIHAQILVLEKQLTAQRVTLENNRRGLVEDIKAVEIQILQIEDQIAHYTIISPVKGTVLVKYSEAGELAVSGMALLKIADLDNMFLRAYVTSDQLTHMKLGETVDVIVDSGEKDNRFYKGVLMWISGEAEFTPKTIQTRNERSNLVYAVKIAVPNDGYLKIGMYGGIKEDYE